MNKNERAMLERDGVVDVKPELYESFMARCYRSSSNAMSIVIPIEIRRFLQLKPGTVLQVAVRVIDKSLEKEYEYRTKRRPTAEQVICPECNRIGSLLFQREGLNVYHCIYHGKKHGFDDFVIHYIEKIVYPEFYQVHKLKGENK